MLGFSFSIRSIALSMSWPISAASRGPGWRPSAPRPAPRRRCGWCTRRGPRGTRVDAAFGMSRRLGVASSASSSRAPLLEAVGDVLEEDEAEHDVLVLARLLVAAQRVGGVPEPLLQGLALDLLATRAMQCRPPLASSALYLLTSRSIRPGRESVNISLLCSRRRSSRDASSPQLTGSRAPRLSPGRRSCLASCRLRRTRSSSRGCMWSRLRRARRSRYR